MEPYKKKYSTGKAIIVILIYSKKVSSAERKRISACMVDNFFFLRERQHYNPENQNQKQPTISTIKSNQIQVKSAWHTLKVHSFNLISIIIIFLIFKFLFSLTQYIGDKK